MPTTKRAVKKKVVKKRIGISIPIRSAEEWEGESLTELKRLAKQGLGSIAGFRQSILDYVRRVGPILAAMKKQVKDRGEKWEEWVEKNLGLKPRTASIYMDMVAHWDVLDERGLTDGNSTITDMRDALREYRAGRNGKPTKRSAKRRTKSPESSNEDDDEANKETDKSPTTYALRFPEAQRKEFSKKVGRLKKKFRTQTNEEAIVRAVDLALEGTDA